MSLIKSKLRLLFIVLIATVVVVTGLLVFRVFNFVDDLRANRIGDALPTPDVQVAMLATVTAQARLCAASANCTTAPVISVSVTSLASTPVPSIAPTATPNISNSKVVQRIKSGERLNVMYAGYGGPGHDGEYLTDTILVLSYDPKTQTVAQFNIPRDLYVPVPGLVGGKTFNSKVNGVFSTIMKWEKPTQDELDSKYRWTDKKSQHEAGANLLANTVQNVLNLKIDYWATMNFDAFRSLIDKMGGVTVCVERSFVDNDYPRNDNDQIDAAVMTIKFDKGCQVMNGERAIQYSRSRKSKGLEEGDFARSARQMKVISAIKDEAPKKNLAVNALGYMEALQGNLRVSMEPDELFALANYFNSSEGKTTIQDLKFDPEIMTGNNFLQDIDKGGALGYVLLPKAGESSFSDIHAWVKQAFQYSSIRREQVRIQVLNASGVQGKASNLSDFLDLRGFRQAQVEAVATEEESFLLDFTNGTATANLNQLKQFLPNIKVVSRPADKKPYENAPDMILYVGKDYKGVANSGQTSDWRS